MLMPLMAVVALAQRSFTGMIVDDAQDPIHQTTVKLLKTDSTRVASTASNTSGKFTLTAPDPRTFTGMYTGQYYVGDRTGKAIYYWPDRDETAVFDLKLKLIEY